jgi:hypothetical protein
MIILLWALYIAPDQTALPAMIDDFPNADYSDSWPTGERFRTEYFRLAISLLVVTGVASVSYWKNKEE